MGKRLFLVVLDSLGIGAAPDADAYGDQGSHTLKAISENNYFSIPVLRELGLFNIEGADCGKPVASPTASYARIAEKSVGKDTIVGHWEIAGCITREKMPTFPDGFPVPLMQALEKATGRPVLCGLPYSGTQVLVDYGQEHVKTGALIVYTSADSVMQIAAHEDVVSLPVLYEACEAARELMTGENGVGRIIARPFAGEYPNYARTSNRHDCSLAPPQNTMLDIFKAADLDVIGVGKIFDIFAGRGLTRSLTITGNADGMMKAASLAAKDFNGLCFVNLVDFDTMYGHRNDVEGYARALTAFDSALPTLMKCLGPEDALLITADHGCDPSTPSTDHSREYVPMLFYGAGIKQGVDLGTRSTFADIAATVLEYFDLPVTTEGTSFYHQVRL